MKLIKRKHELTIEQRKLDTNLWIIALVTMLAYSVYAVVGSSMMAFFKDSSISVWPRLLTSAAMEYGVAGLGITLVCIIRRESFASYGLKRENAVKAILGAIICFIPLIVFKIASGQFEGYAPLSVMVSADLHKAGIISTIIGTLIIGLVWGFFEGFNYAVIAEIISRRHPVKNKYFDWGVLVAAIMGIMFHPIHFDTVGIIDLIVTFIALYGMLIVRKHTGNSWGCVFAFIFIWNAF